MEINIVRDTDSLEALGPRWRELCQHSAHHHYFQTFGWVWAWWTTVGQDANCRLNIVTVEDSGRLVLVLPLVVQRSAPWRVLTWTGRDGDYGDALIADDEQGMQWLEAAWGAVAKGRGYDVAVLDQVRPDSRIGPFLARHMGAREGTVVSPFLTCRDWPDWDAYSAARKGRFGRDQRRRRRRLEEQGSLRYEVVSDDAEIEELVRWMNATKGAWVKRTNRVQRAAENEFVAAVVREAQASGTLYLAALKLDGAVIATDLGLIYRGWHYSWLSAFDNELRSFSPGRVILENSLMWSFQNDVAVFDLLSGADKFKFDWATDEVALETYAWPRTAWGWVYCQAMYGATRALVRKLFRALPGGLRNRLIERFLAR